MERENELEVGGELGEMGGRTHAVLCAARFFCDEMGNAVGEVAHGLGTELEGEFE